MLPAALLLDMDGTLVDTEPSWMAAETALVEAHGGTWTHEDALAMVGSDLIVAARRLREHGGVRLGPEQIVDHLLAAVCEDVRRHQPWRPGARELLDEARALGVPCALVTMSWAPLADIVVASVPPGTFAAVVTGDAVSHGKPHPEPYLRAAELLGVAPQDCVAVEDSATGATSASRAGVPTVGVPHVVDIPPLPGVVLAETLAGLGVEGLTSLARG